LSSGTYTITFSGTTKTSSFNDSVTAVKSNIIGNSAGIQFTNDGTAGKNGQFVLSGSAITLYGDIRSTNPAASNAISMTDEIKNDLKLTSASSTLIYTASFGSLAHNLILSGAVSEASSGLIFRKGGTGGTLFLSGENTFTGMMQIYVGAVSVDRFENIGAPSPLGAGNLPIQVGNGNLSGAIIYTGTGETTNRYITVGAGPASAAIGGATITNNGSGPLIFDAANRSAAGANPYDNGRFNTNYQGDNTAPSRTLTLSGTNVTDSEIRSVIADQSYASVTTSIPLAKTGSGKWILSGANTYSGTTTISGGTLQVGNSGTTGNLGTGPVVNNATLAFKRSDDIAYDLDITGAGTLVKAGAGVLTFGTAQSYTGPTSIEAGTLSLGENGSVAASSRITVAAGASLSVADVLTGAYAVPATQTLGGDGTVVGAVTLGAGATVSPGAGAGTLSVTDAVTWNSGGNYTVSTQTAAGTISRAALTLTAVTASKTYDGGVAAAGTPTSAGLKGSDTVTGLSQVFDSQNAGNRTVRVSPGYAVSDGNGGGNYTVTLNTASGVIAQRILALSADNKDKLADAVDPALTWTLNSGALVTGDALTGALSRDPGEGVGLYAILQGSLTAGGNYQINFTNGQFEVRAR
jgi:autotransporter-associated beta strand protein